MDSRSRPLNMVFLPYLAPGHMIPLSEMARLFAARGEHVTIITTPSNATLLQNSIDKDKNSGHHIGLHLLQFPAKEASLPDGLENFVSVTDLETAGKLFHAVNLLRNQIENFLSALRPDCIVSDMFYPWTADLAARLRIPRLVFHATCIFALCLDDSMRGPDAPHRKVQSDSETFLIQGLPDPVTMTRSQLPDYVRTPNGYTPTQSMEQRREAELKSYGVIVNNFYEIESSYTEHYKNIMGHKIWHIGPSSLIHRNARDKSERGHKTVVGEHECLSWLDTKKPNSVLYVCFGSMCRFPDHQLFELACGLESSGHQFIWVVLGKDDEKPEDQEKKWLPLGFVEKMKEGDKGMILKGWAPQVLILDHPSIGGFLTHCGWNSVLEGVSAGVPMVTWPLYAEHFYNEKLITQVLGTGVEVGVEDWNNFVDAGKKVVSSERIEKAVRRVMDGGDEAVTMMRRAREVGVMAKRAVEDGGSSHRNLTALIEELKELRNNI